MQQKEVRFNSVVKGVIFLLLLVALGSTWFVVMEGHAVLDAVYMTIITLSTVGFQEVHKLDASGRVFVIFLIVSGLTVLTYTLSSVGRAIVEGTLQRYVGRQRMMREIDNLRDHYIICGHGRMGEILCRELRREKVPFLVIESEPEGAEKLGEDGFLVIEGDSTDDEVLRQAGVTRAKGLVAVVSRDVDNLYITLSAREMCRQENPALYILSRATDQVSARKITRAGADRVISPYAIGGMRLVQALLRPTVYDFVDIATSGSGLELMFDEVSIAEDSRLNDVAIKDSGIRASFDVIIIAIKKPTGRMVFNPGPDAIIQGGDVLIMLGDKEQLERLTVSLS